MMQQRVPRPQPTPFWERHLVRQRTLTLWWNTGTDAAREEPPGVQATAPRFEMRATCSLVSILGVAQDGGDALQVTGPVFGIKWQRDDQCVGGVADLAQRERRIFPPAAAESGEPGTNG